MSPLNVTANGTLAGENGEKFSPPTPFPTSKMPAWAPSVAVASAMLIFLTASFYIRHRKVVKKRELLMDYFYIIFQYGGLRRKRMVAALCNTNAITLRELGRSFMISFDSVNNPENSCPFFLEDNSAFGGSPHFAAANSAHKKTFFNRATHNSRKYRMPFRRNPTHLSDENPGSYPVSFHDILMKFKSKRPPPAPPGTPCMRPRSPSRLEMHGSSMCTIHGDDFDYQKYMEENEINSPVFYNRTRRNAYIPQPSPKVSSRFADLVCEAKRHSLGSVYQEHMMTESKRNSEPFEYQGPGGVFQLYGDRLTPGDTTSGPRNLSEPSILVHSASSDWSNDGNGWTELPGPSGEGGVVFVRRLSRVDAQPGEYTYCHDSCSTPQLGLARRANLSKVNVQSVNTTEYYNCLQRGTTVCPTVDRSPGNTSGENTPTRDPGRGPPRRARGRLSLGEIAVSNLNRRIDLTSESLKEYDPDVPGRSKNRWARFKHVFSGSRIGSSKSSSIPSNASFGKGAKLVPTITEERTKTRSHHQSSTTRWQKFVNVFTGFRSLPEQNSTQTEPKIPSGSRSFPADLNMKQASSSYERAESIELDPQDAVPVHACLDMDTDLTSNEPSHRFDRFQRIKPYENFIPKSPGVNSLRESSPVTRPGTRRFRSVFLAYKATQPSTFTGSKRYRKKYDSVTSSSQSLPYISNLDLKASPSTPAHQISPLAKEDKHRPLADPQEGGAGLRVELEASSDPPYQGSYSPDEHSPCHDYSPRRAHNPRGNLLLRLDQSHNQTLKHDSQGQHGSVSVAGQWNTTQSNSVNAAPSLLDVQSSNARVIKSVCQARGTFTRPFSSESSDCFTDQSLCTLLPNSDLVSHRPFTAPLAPCEVKQNLLSPDSWQACASSESVYYDTLSSPMCSPLPARPANRHPQSNVSGSLTRLDYSSSDCQSQKPFCDIDPSLQVQNHTLASPDWRPHRRRSEELRPKKHREDKSVRRKSAISNMSSIGSSLLTSTEVILVPMTISAPDSPVSSRPSSPGYGRINNSKSNLLSPAPSIRLSPSHCPKHSPIRLTLSCPNRSESDVTLPMSSEGEASSHTSPGLRRKSDRVHVEYFSSSTPATPVRHNQAGPCTRTWFPKQEWSAGKECPGRFVHQSPGKETRPSQGSGEVKDTRCATRGSRPPQLLRQTSQDVKSGPRLGCCTEWEPKTGPVTESLECVNRWTSTSPLLSPSSQQTVVSPTSPGVSGSTPTHPGQQQLTQSQTSISKSAVTFDLQDTTLTPDTTQLPFRRCSYDTLI